MYGMIEVLQSMLAGPWDCCMNPILNENRMQLVKSLHSIPKAFKRGRIDGILMGNVTGVHERCNGADHHRWDISYNCRRKNLEDMVSMPDPIRWSLLHIPSSVLLSHHLSTVDNHAHLGTSEDQKMEGQQRS
jgi:hypothetical protein